MKPIQQNKPLGISEGLDLTKIDEITQAEIDENLIAVFRYRRPLYEMYSNALMLDYAPDFAKLHRWGSDLYGRPQLENIIALAVQNLHMYIHQGWETGILNSFHTLRRAGLKKKEIMEVVMFAQLSAGMRGLGHTYHAVGDLLPIMSEVTDKPVYPEGWAPDPDAFKSGLTLDSRELSAQDRKNLTEWYEKTIGYVPKSIQFGLKYHPEFVKVHRAKYERCIKLLPKQVAPFMMLRYHTISGNKDGLREAALHAKAWGLTPEWIVRGITSTAFFFTGFDGLYVAQDAIADLL